MLFLVERTEVKDKEEEYIVLVVQVCRKEEKEGWICPRLKITPG